VVVILVHQVLKFAIQTLDFQIAIDLALPSGSSTTMPLNTQNSNVLPTFSNFDSF
jgi:hypothetical protein